jgi:hypothetical protein
VDIWPVEQQAPSTSSQPSLAYPCQWIRRGTRRYTQHGAAFQNSNYVPPTALAPPTSKSEYIPTTVLRTLTIRHRLQKTPSTGPANHTAPLRASGRSRPPPTSTKPWSHHTWSCAANTRNPLRPQPETTLQTYLSPSPTTNRPQSTCLQTLTTHPRPDMCYCGIGPRMRPPRTTTTPELSRGTSARSTQHCAPTTPIRPRLRHGLGTLTWHRTPLVLAAPTSTTYMKRVADLLTRRDDPYRCDRPAPSHTKE